MAGEQTVEEAVTRASHALGRSWRWLRPLARRYVARFAGDTRPRLREVLRFLGEDGAFGAVSVRHFRKLGIEHWITAPAIMQPAPAAEGWNLPTIVSLGALAEWLAVSVEELDWFADLKALGYKQGREKLRHYSYRVLTKPSGDVRLIEAPKTRLKQIQRRILTDILDRIPPHEAAHGFRQGRSTKTFALPHTAQRVVLRMDLRDFFPTVSGARIQTVFRTLGYPEPVADILGGLCTNATPRSVLKGHREAQELYRRPHLPQGAPSSPALANVCAYRADGRLDGLARSAGAIYTRYADDLAFSGDAEFARRVERFSHHAAAILLEEGWPVNHRKTRIMRQGVRQHLAGLVVNQDVSLKRADLERLEAILTNCLRLGPATQNRAGHPDFRAHLQGQVAYVEMIHAGKGRRLRALLERIAWP